MMLQVREQIRQLNFDLRRISDLATATAHCLRSDLGELNHPIDPKVYAIMQSLTSSEQFSYAPTLGDPALIQSLEAFETPSLQHFQQSAVLVTSGAQAALFAIFSSVLQAGKKILTDTHYYPPYKNLAQLFDAQLLCKDLNSITASDLTDVQILLINSPSNPTGRIYDAASLERLAQLARQHDILVVEDAVYNRIYFQSPPSSIAAYCPERTLIINSASKNFCMPGMRIGWLMGESHWVLQIAKLHRNMNSCPNSFFQKVLAAYIPQATDYFQHLRQEMQSRRDLMIQLFQQLGWPIITPQGGIYIFAHVPDMKNDYDFVSHMIKHIGVSAIPGSLFGDHQQHLRFCYGALQQHQIQELAHRLQQL